MTTANPSILNTLSAMSSASAWLSHLNAITSKAKYYFDVCLVLFLDQAIHRLNAPSNADF